MSTTEEHPIYLDKKLWFKGLLGLWVIFSFVYIAYDFGYQGWQRMKEQAFLAANEQVVQRLMQEATNKDCKPFPVSYQKQKVFLINTACLKTDQAHPK
uniref:Uncharacterized protein n=1 Tax=Candidatus Kentrum sp. UNK TaxID=2126344 RepID=A0A451B1R9_9GAMM|nr:MAG: hypothetical protein BECKUNK1418G_GA0071005_11098 [Candidatus Kentron sp. UNK]VFK72230.1 MAG: hypothetical protein BECKUNK1418H_GA0071006_11028 [Candidatus Kentron sp. UNK]